MLKMTKLELQTLINEAVAKKVDALKTLSSLKEEKIEKKKGDKTEEATAKQVVAFTKKFDDLVTKMIEDSRSLADAGEELMKNGEDAKLKNEILLHRVGLLRGIANSMSTVFERCKRRD